MSVELHDGTTAYEGRTVRLTERNGYDDSDFMAVVMEEDGTFIEVMYGTTRFAWPGRATVDAAPDVAAAYKAHLAAERDAAHLAAVRREAATLRKGVAVRVAKGRKVPVGTTGTVGWLGVATYGYRKTVRVGIRVEGEEKLIFTAATNLVVLDSEHGELEPSNA